jgi:hypothetical protein
VGSILIFVGAAAIFFPNNAW